MLNQIKSLLDQISKSNCECLQIMIVDVSVLMDLAPKPIRYINLLNVNQEDLILRPWRPQRKECQIEDLSSFIKPTMYIVVNWPEYPIIPLSKSDWLFWRKIFSEVSEGRIPSHLKTLKVYKTECLKTGLP